MQTIYAEKFEKQISDFALKLFKKVGLSHWTTQSKVMWMVLASLLPFIAGFSFFLITCMLKCVNRYHLHSHESELNEMEQDEKNLQR